MHKAGFVNIVGNPNVGKSTLMNALVGERISIATFKAQTTRHRIMGIYNTDDIQIVFSDTPGVLKPTYKLQESMLNFSTSALTDADVLLYVTDVVETPDKHNDFVEKVSRMEVPVLLLVNKIDLSNQEKLVELVEAWKELLPNAEIIPISAATKFNVDYVMKRIKELLPDSPPYFDKDQWTDKPARFFVNEIIREKILLYYDKEIPYSVEVVVEQFKEEEKKIHINAVIYVERDSQKGIIIGKQGKALKKVATEARRDLGMIFQSAALFDSMTVLDNVMFPLNMFSSDTLRDRTRRAMFCLERVNLVEAKDKFPGEISGGMQKRVAIARAIALNPQYLFCDEPNSGLDPKTSLVIDELIQDITREYNMTTLINTHDMNSVMGIGEKIIYIYEGHKEWEGSKNDIFTSTNERLNNFIFASDLFRKVKEVEIQNIEG